MGKDNINNDDNDDNDDNSSGYKDSDEDDNMHVLADQDDHALVIFFGTRTRIHLKVIFLKILFPPQTCQLEESNPR